ncbi:DUF6114 domain-containing protein [Streptomyces gardneri]|uniref:DUF6114 domain-containing protein n=1 Tax=Streptomyces gardneri TaxID=66892 RepID=UPI0036BA99C9
MLSGAARSDRAERADPAVPAAPAGRAARIVGAARERCGQWVRWFRAFRRTRPFWGGLWLIAGGWTVLKFSLSSLQLIVSTGFGGVAGYLVGGGMILCGLIPMALPAQRYTFGLIGAVLAVVSLVVSNLGGFLLGMALGVLGGSMTVGWGAKRPRRGAVEG